MSPTRRLRFVIGATVLAGAISILSWSPQPADPQSQPPKDARAQVVNAAEATPIADPASKAATTLEPAKADQTQNAASKGLPPGGEPVVSPKLTKEAASAQFHALRRDLNWKKPMPEPEMAQFVEWTDRYTKAAPRQRGMLLAEGVKLATARRTALAQMIEDDPVRALEVAVPVAVRREMPLEVENLLETDVKGKGDLMVEAAMPLPGDAGAAVRAEPIRRTAIINGEEYDTYVGPRRRGQPSRTRIPLHGIAVDGKLAASDYPGRAVEPVEVAEAKSVLGGDQICSTSGLNTEAGEEESVIEVAGDYKFFCGANHAMAELNGLATDESNLPLGYGFDVAGSPYTEGQKKIIIIRVDFSDSPGDPASLDVLTTLVGQNKTFWEEMSYGKTSWFPVGTGGSEITKTLRLPLTSSNYTALGTIRSAARTAATNAGYNLSNYNFDLIITGSKPSVGFAGVGYVGGPGCWVVNGYWTRQVTSHELGHNFGLNHANSWDTTDNTTIGAGSSTEYGDGFDTMGVAANEQRRHYNSRYKNYLNWLTSNEVQTITASGTYRVFAHDVQTASGIRGLRIPRTKKTGEPTTADNYWVDARQQFSDNRWVDNGVFLHWTHNGNSQSNLLDTTPGSSGGKNDSALVVGRTFSDPQGIHITPIARTTTSPADSVDVVVNLGLFTTNRKPTLTIAASTLTPAVGTAVTFTATAADADNDTLAYYWEYTDGTFGTNNSTVTKTWTTNTEQVVRCTVTDMKGGTASASLVVRVGNPSTYSIVGQVSDDTGGVAGVTVTAGTKRATSNSDGSYAIVGLTSGSYTVAASDPVKVYLPVGFTNPVVVPPSGKAINFGTAPATPKLTALPPITVNLNTPIGPLPITVEDKDTPLNLLTMSATSDNVTLIAPKDVVFGGSGANRTVSVTPGTNQTGSAIVKVICSDPQGNQSSQDWFVTVNEPPSIVVDNGIRSPEDTVLDINLWNLAGDAQTPDAGLLFDVTAPTNGTISLLADGHTARFIPAKDATGPATFQMSVTDQSSEPRLFLYYSFEGPDVSADGKATDSSNFGRTGSLEVVGGGEFAYADDDVPPATALYDRSVLNLVENYNPADPTAIAAARLTRLIPAGELNLNTSSWTFAAWFQRQGTDTDDIVFHVGDGPGAGTTDQLLVRCPAGASTVALEHYGSGGRDLFIQADVAADVPWHHVAVVYSAGSPNKFELYVDGVLAGSAANVALNMSQVVPVVFGGHNQEATSTERYFNGKLDELAMWSTALTAAEVARVSKVIIPHFSGITRSALVNISISPVNDGPVISAIEPQVTDEDSTLTIPFTITDDSTPASSLSPSVTCSNPGLVPAAGLVLSGTGSARTLKVSPNLGATGTASITIKVGDGTLESSLEFQLTVLPKNDPPEITAVSNVNLPEDGSAVLLPFDIFDKDTTAAQLTVVGTSSNQALVPDANISVQGTGLHRAVTVDPAANASGSATITLTVSDGQLTASTHFVVTVGSSNDAPVIGAIANQTTSPGVAVGPIAFTVSDAETPAGQLTIAAKSSNPKLLPDFSVALGGADGDRTLTLTPIAGQLGSATVTLFVSDGTTKSARSFSLVVEGDGNLRVLVEGEGTVTSGFLGKSQRAPGQSLTITAQPKAGFAFAGWSGGITSSAAKLSFLMPDTLELTAKFVPSPFSALKGKWNGLVEDLPATHGGTGLISLKVAPTGTFTGTLTLGGAKTPLKGTILADGSTGPLTVSGKNLPTAQLNLQFGGIAGENKMTGTLTAGNVTSEVNGDLAVFTASKAPASPMRNVPLAWLGKYTFAVEDSQPDGLVGSAYATLTVLPTGVVRGVGKLADGTRFTYSNTISGEGAWPMYLSLYKGTGALAGWVNWELKENSDLDGALRWFRPPGANAAAVRAWSGPLECEAVGSRYTPPAPAKNGQPAVPVLPMFEQPGATGNLQASFAISETATVAQNVMLTVDGKLSVLQSPANTSLLQLSLNSSTGILTGTFVDANGAKHQTSGVLLQRANRGTGFHLAPGNAGPFRLQKAN